MGNNRFAAIRYQVLDRCLRNIHKRYYLDDLVDECNKVLADYGTSVSKRTVQSDIVQMETNPEHPVTIKKIPDGHAKYYRYENPNDSYFESELTEEEREQLNNVVTMLSRFEGLPMYEWVDEIIARFREEFALDETPEGVVCFQQNAGLTGMEYFSELFDAIVGKNVLNIDYKPFGVKLQSREIHPYQLKQYNTRWFLVGAEPAEAERYPYAVLALDRIKRIRSARNVIYQEQTGMDLEEYFSDVVGVSIMQQSHRDHVVIKATKYAKDYIQTKRLHHSQKVVERGEGYVIFSFDVVLNYEFETLLLGFADQCKILEPVSLRKKILKRVRKIEKMNSGTE
jgi:predicted DNA-binding transcriptional regulator YafY